MKTLKIIAIGIFLLASSASQAQVSVNVNIGTPPSWGPSGYSNAEFYYLPEVHAYYDIRSSLFVYFGNGHWNRSRYLPRQYRNYNLYNGYKIVLNGYHGNRPYAHFNNHKIHYKKGQRYERQRAIGVRNNYNQNTINRRYTNERRYADNKSKANKNYNKRENREYKHDKDRRSRRN